MTAVKCFDSTEFDGLMRDLFDGTLSDADAVRLEALLLADWQAREAYRRWMEIEALLECGLAGPPGTAPSERYAPRIFRGEQSRFGRRRKVVWGALVFAATGALITIFTASALWWPAGAGGIPVAILTAETDAHLLDPRTGIPSPVTLGSPLVSGPLRLEQGAVQLTFGNGAEVAVNAPAEIELINQSRVFLRRGTLVPFVPPRARGFTVLSPGGEIIDLGTEFSVHVTAAGAAEVDVIDGEVVVAEGGSSNSVRQHLTAGFSANLPAGDVEQSFRVEGVPLLMDHFGGPDSNDLCQDLLGRQSGLLAIVPWLSIERDAPARIWRQGLEIPFEAPPDRRRTMTRVALNRVFEELVGRRWSVSFKAWLPPKKTTPANHFVALIVACGDDPKDLPFAWEERSAIAIMLSNKWQAGIDLNGGADPPPAPALAVFPRSESGTGPYQVMLAVDERGPGDARISVLVNGCELLREVPLSIDRHRGRIIGFHTWTHENSNAHSYARIDDFWLGGDFAVANASSTESELTGGKGVTPK